MKIGFIAKLIYNSIDSFVNILLPSRCYHCNENLVKGEKYLCLHCFLQLAYGDMEEEDLKTKYLLTDFVEHFVVCFKYRKESPIQTLIHKFKYQQNIRLGKVLIDIWIENTNVPQWLNDIDVIIPMPLHRRKKAKRGYNQSEMLARCIGKKFGKPVINNAIVRKNNTPSQTSFGIDRKTNMENAFRIGNIQKIQDKHILIIDDVITSGSTLQSCIHSVCKVFSYKVSCLLLAQEI